MKDGGINKERGGSWPRGCGTAQRSPRQHQQSGVQGTLRERLGCQINIYTPLFEEELDERPLSHSTGVFSTAAVANKTLKAALGCST